MDAKAKNYYNIIITDEPHIFKVPFFQRKYVWDKDNWEELFDSFQTDNLEKYLGSIIIKKIMPNEYNKNEMVVGEIIDGQQRLTTISILTKAIYDSIKNKQRKEDIKVSNIYQTLFYAKGMHSTVRNNNKLEPKKLIIKIEHSRLDKDYYSKIMYFDIKNDASSKKEERKSPIEEALQIINKNKCKSLDEEIEALKKVSNILACYYYYIKKLESIKDDEKLKIMDNIYPEPDDNNKGLNRFVLMKLEDAENREQEIFDTINRAGQTLTCADIIKNDLFKTLLEKDKSKEEEVVTLCDECWEKVFYEDHEKRQYWENRERLVNVGERTHIEILLLFIAIIEFHGDGKENTEDIYKKFVKKCHENLSWVYKKFIYSATEQELKSFIKRIKIYADIFYYFYKDNEDLYRIEHKDILKLLLVTMKQCKLKLIFPIIMSLVFGEMKNLKTFDPASIISKINSNDKLASILINLNKYILLNSVCDIKASTNILAKDICFIHDANFIKKYFEINDKKQQIINSLIKIEKNNIAKIILFNLEFNMMKEEDDIADIYYDKIELEHILPIKWKEKWGKEWSKYKKDKCSPDDYKFKIGNMLILKDKMNSKIQNSSFKEKMEGVKKGKRIIPGYAETIKFKTSKGIVDEYNNKKYNWDPKHIDNRTNEIIRMLEGYLKLEDNLKLRKRKTKKSKTIKSRGQQANRNKNKRKK